MLHQQQSRNCQHLEPLTYGRRLVGVDFDQLHPTGKLTSELLERRAHHPAGTAPGRPDVHQHRDGGGFNHARKIRVGGIHHPAQRLMTLSTARYTVRHCRYPVLGVTVRALDDLCRGILHVRAHAAALSSGGGPLTATTVSSPSTTSTEITPPSGRSPRNSARATRVSTSRAMKRRNGRAPYAGSNP